MTLEAGASRIDVTPRRRLPNYNGEPIEEGSAALWAHVAVCADEERVVVVSVDATFVDRPLLLRLRDELRRRVGISPGNVHVAATHTHNAPATSVSFLSGASPDPLYLDYLVDRIGTATERAAADLDPVDVLAGTVDCSPIVACRRRVAPSGQVYLPGADPDPGWDAEGPIDREMQFLALRNRAGEFVAVLVNVPCHNHATIVEDPPTYDGDMFDRAGSVLREELGEDVVTPVLPAPCGDVTWQSPEGGSLLPGDTGKERARAGGRAIAERVLDALSDAGARTEAGLATRTITRRIRDRPHEQSHYCRDGCRGESRERLERIRERYDPEEEAVEMRGETSCTVELSCIGLGPFALVTNPAELFSIYGERIKAASPHEVTLVSELTDGYCGYVPRPDSFERGGYETHRTVYTSRLHERAAEELRELSVDLLDAVHGTDAIPDPEGDDGGP